MLTYNRADVLPRSLDSLLSQTYQNFELIINDDCSTDETKKISKKYEKKDPRVRYVRNEKNLKYAGNNNAAIDRAKGKYVGLVHDGDVYEESLVEKWVSALEEHPSAAFVFQGHYNLETGESHTHGYRPLVNGDDLLETMLLQWGSPVFGIAMVRKSSVEAVGPFDTSFPRRADVDMWMRLLDEYNAAYVDEPLVHYAPREEGHELDVNVWESMKEKYDIRKKNIDIHFEKEKIEKYKYIRKLKFDSIKLYFWNMLWCLKEGRFGKFLKGVKLFIYFLR